MFFFSKNINANDKRTLYEFSFNDVDGKTYLLSQHKNKVVLLVNVASQCGFTKQYADLQTLWDKYKSKNFVVIGVPSNDFGKRMQTGNTSKMIHKMNFLTSYVSEFMTLMPGDLFTTGTPPGVGDSMKPPTYLKKGDTVTLMIDQLGSQKHSVK